MGRKQRPRLCPIPTYTFNFTGDWSPLPTTQKDFNYASEETKSIGAVCAAMSGFSALFHLPTLTCALKGMKRIISGSPSLLRVGGERR